MPTKYTPGMSLMTGIVTAVVGLAGLLSGGCQSPYKKLYDSLSPEEQAKWSQAEYNLLGQKYEQQRKQDDENLAAAGQLSQYTAQQQQIQANQQTNNSNITDHALGDMAGRLLIQGWSGFIGDSGNKK